jgi:ABC-type polysaccharide/polyol phosphate transport system ATPase subunit
MAAGSGALLIEFDRVGKRYTHMRRRDSLRDAIPRLARGLAARERRVGRAGMGEHWAIRDVSFTVSHGEALGIVGHNGAGKSTILKLLAGVTAPTFGHVRVKGRLAALIEIGAGFHADLTGRENIYLNGSILGLKRAEVARKLESIVDFADLEQFIDVPVKYYSTGMYARLGFSVAAHVEPEVLLVDEVLSVGDQAFQQKCMRRMEAFRRDGVALVFVSHNLDAVAKLCTGALLMRAGLVVVGGTPAEVIGAYRAMPHRLLTDEEAARIAEPQYGYITRHMEILGAELRDACDRPAAVFHGGAPATLTIRLRANRQVQEPLVSMCVRNSAAMDVYATSTALLQASIGDVATGEEIVATFPFTVNLCQGIYTIQASVLPRQGQIEMDRREVVATFQVVDDGTASGIADLRASAQVRRVNDEGSAVPRRGDWG